jgi:hypothetical protein
MMTDSDHDSVRGSSPVPLVEQEAVSLILTRDEIPALPYGMQPAWASLQAVPSYVEQQARAFVQACDALGIEAQAEE